MIDHLSSYATDFEVTKAFYSAVLPLLGYDLGVEMVTDWDEEFPTRRICAFGPEAKPCFWICEVREAASPRHIAFTAPHRAAVNGFHLAGLKAGGTDNGAPGERPIYHPGYYGAFLLDPDGNNVEAVHHGT